MNFESAKAVLSQGMLASSRGDPNGRDCLALRLVCLKGTAQWAPIPEVLTFLFLEKGKTVYTYGQLTTQLLPGDTLIVNGAHKGKLLVTGGPEAVFQAFALRLEQLFPLFAPEEISLLSALDEQLGTFKRYPASHRLAKEGFQLVKTVPSEPSLDQRAQLLRIVTLLLAEEFEQARRRRTALVRTNKEMAQRLQSLSREQLLGLSVDELAARFSCSRRHLNRLFHQHFGISVGALRMELRMMKAASLLRDPTAKVVNVAAECGFSHLGLFNTCFKKRFGISPSEWRKRCQQPGTPSAQPLGEAACQGYPNPTGQCSSTAKRVRNQPKPNHWPPASAQQVA